MFDRILRRKEVCQLLGISRGTLWRWCRDGYFPPAMGLYGTGLQGWRESTLNAWLDENFPKEQKDLVSESL